MNEAEFPDYRNKLVGSLTFMKTTLNSLVGTYQILLMTINRFTDYTKISHEIPLVPTMESVHLIDTIFAPISCVQDLQSRIHVDVEPIDKKISEFIMTDRQWLQDNILCLVSNAVKFSMRGNTVVRVLLTSSSTSGLIPFSSDSKSVQVTTAEHKDIFHDLEIGRYSRSDTPDADQLPPTQMIRFEVEDHGVGIMKSLESRQNLNPDMLSSDGLTIAVFSEPNIAAKRAAGNVGGSGLGLYCLAQRVEALGGQYGVEEKRTNDISTKTSGTLFWFTIPYSPDYGKLKPAPSLRSSRHSPAEAKVHDPFSYRWFDHSKGILPEISPLSSLDLLKESLSIKSSISMGNSKSLPSPSRKIQFRESTFTLPQQKLSPPSSPRTGEKIEKASSSGGSQEHAIKPSCQEHILVVDDSLAIVKMLKIMLEKKGFLVSTASNGLEAVELINSYVTAKSDTVNMFPPIDAILMDIQMPIMDGIEAINRIRQIEKTTLKEPENSAVSSSDHFNHLIVAMSASSDDETVNSAYTAGADEFIAKPFNVVSFQKILAEYDDRKRAQTLKADDSDVSAVQAEEEAAASNLPGEVSG
jgi:CheY-like chemotaxis protein